MTYLHWLQKGSFDSNIEKYPLLDSKFETSLKRCFVAGDLTSIPLLKMASNGNSNLVDQLINDRIIERNTDSAGVAGVSAALKANEKNINYILLESNQAYSAIANFPVKKPILLEPKHIKIHSKLNLLGHS